METLSWWVGLALALVAAVFDWRTRHIPNYLVGWGAVAGLVAVTCGVLLDGGLAPLPWALLRHLLGGLVCGVLPLLLWFRGALGGGDVKLLAAIGVSYGPVHGMQIEMWAFVAAAVYALGVAARRGELRRIIGRNLEAAHKVGEPDWAENGGQFLVFAPPLCVAVIGYSAEYWLN